MRTSTPSSSPVIKGVILFFKKAKLCCTYFNSNKSNDALIGYLNLEWRDGAPTDLNKYKLHNFETRINNPNHFVFPSENRRHNFKE